MSVGSLTEQSSRHPSLWSQMETEYCLYELLPNAAGQTKERTLSLMPKIV
jgi:hypothetical protein